MPTLPRYVVQPSGRLAFYWQVPTRHRVAKDGKPWPHGTVRLPDDRTKMEAEAARLNTELDQIRAGVTPETRRGTMPWLIAHYENPANKMSKFHKLTPGTKDDYRSHSKHVLAWSAEKRHPQVRDLTTPKVLEFLTRFDDRPTLKIHVASYLRTILKHAIRIGEITHNPATQLDLEKPKRQKKIRTIDVPELLALVAKAHEMALPHVAMGALLHFDLGQRQGDILRLQKPRDYRGGVFQFDQSKTGQEVTIKPFLTETRAALEALPLAQLMLVADENGQQVRAWRYWSDFRKVADAAGFPDLWEMELRHSCVIFCERAGLTPGEIATRTGHSLKTVFTILENYRYRDSIVAAQGAVKLEDYRNRAATKV